MFRIYTILILAAFTLTFFLSSCSKNDSSVDGGNTGFNLSAFNVTVVERAPSTAILSWDEVLAPGNSLVHYDILINNRTVKVGLLTQTDTLLNLSADTLYKGKVIARTNAGDTVSAAFELERINGYLVVIDYEGALHAVSLPGGTKLWKVGGSPAPYKYQGICTVVNDVVYVNSDTYGTSAINAKTGQIIWNNDFGSPGSAGSRVSPYYKDGKVFTTAGTKLRALNASTGETIWTFQDGNNYYGTYPLIDQQLLFIYCGQKMLAINPETGQKVWELTTAHPCVSPVIAEGLLIFSAADGKLRALDQLRGTEVWTVDFGPRDLTYTSPTLYKDLVITHGGNTGFYGVHVKTGKVAWNFPETGGTTVSSPTVGGDFVYFSRRGGSGNLAVALHAATGVKVWEKNLDASAFVPSPVFAKGRLYFGNDVTWGYGTEMFNARTGDWLGATASSIYQAFAPTVVIADSTFYVSQSSMKQ